MLTETEKKTIIRWGLLIGVGVLGVILVYVGNKYAVTELTFDEYSFSFEPTDAVLRDFQIYYDFVKEEGTISFDIANTPGMDHIGLGLPRNLFIRDIAWKNGTHNKEGYQFKENEDFRKTEKEATYGGYNIYNIDNKNSSKKGYWTSMVINLDGIIYPNAKFSIDTNGKEISPPRGAENGAFFKFNLGKDFLCENIKCFESFRPGKIVDHYYNNTLRISTQIDSNGKWENVDYQPFTLNYNKKIEKLGIFPIGYFVVIGIGLILLELSLYIQKRVK